VSKVTAIDQKDEKICEGLVLIFHDFSDMPRFKGVRKDRL
jgi:hypothetical protein